MWVVTQPARFALNTVSERYRLTVEVFKPFQSFHGYTVTLYIMYIYYFAVTRLTAAPQMSRAAPDRKINEILVALLHVLVYECECDHRSQSTVEKYKTRKKKSDQMGPNIHHISLTLRVFGYLTIYKYR